MLLNVAEASQLLEKLFDQKQENSNLKRDAILNLEATFAFITEQNFNEYVEYLVEWTQYQVNTSFLELFVMKVRNLQNFLEAKYPSLCQKIVTILFYLLQQQNEGVRKNAIDISVEIFSTKKGIRYLKKSVQQLLKSGDSYSGYDSALALLVRFRKQFLPNQGYVEILGHPCFNQCYKTRKIFLNRVIQLCSQPIEPPLIEYLLSLIAERVSTEDEILHSLAIKARIILLSQAVKNQIVNCESCREEISRYYGQPIMRTKYTLVQMTEHIVQILPPHFVRRHFDYLMENIDPNESEITQLAVEKLKCLYTYISKDQRKSLVLNLVNFNKHDSFVGDAIAKSLTQFLIDQEDEEILVQHIKQFIALQKDKVKLSLIKSFFGDKKSHHWYTFLLGDLKELIQNKVWRVRLESLQILESVFNIFPVEPWVFPILTTLLFDKVSRIRLETIKLIKACINQNLVVKELIPVILAQSNNGNYLYREAILFLIKDTINQVSQQVRTVFKEVVEKMKDDRVQNVRDIVQQIENDCK